MSEGSALVQLALEKLGGPQSKLALKLGVSGAQISKWKKGEHMSQDMQTKLTALAKIGDLHPEFVVKAGSAEKARHWQKILLACARNAEGETAYDGIDIVDEFSEWTPHYTFNILNEMGVVIPSDIPKVLTLVNLEDEEVEDAEYLSDEGASYPLVSLIREIYEAYGALRGFMIATGMDELCEKTNLDGLSGADCIEGNLLWLAAAKVEPDPSLLADEVRHRMFRDRQIGEYRKMLTDLKAAAFEQGLPLKAELMDMIESDAEELNIATESETWGKHSEHRLHPDIYMNELLIGMREIRRALPLILEKLETKSA